MKNEANFAQTIKQLQHLAGRFESVMVAAVVAVAIEGAAIAKEHMNFTHEGQSGLRSKTYGEKTGALSSRLIANTFYASWVEFGNGPPGGRIYPTTAKALRFPMNGQIMFRKWVRTSRPKPFMAPTAKQLISNLPATIERAWAQLLSEL